MDPTALAVSGAFWARVTDSPALDAWQTAVRKIAGQAERRHALADYETGSVTTYEALLLLGLAEWCQARTIVEIGTFVGMSTVALARARTVEAVYTCDASNDCLPADGVIHPYPKQTSTVMLRDLVKRRARADLCFFDGVLMPLDVDLLQALAHPGTIYAFHDYNYGPKIRKGGRLETVPRKGIGNVAAIRPRLVGYALIDPPPETTLAVLVPEGR